jgi:putative membrane protein
VVASQVDTFFSESDREAISAATAEAERNTSGELVVYVVERCDPHPEITWKGTLIGGAVGAACAAVVIRLFGGWGAQDYLWLLIGLQLGLLAGWLASRFEAVGHRLVGSEAAESRVQGRAAEAFVEEQVFATQERTGVLIFVALFERRVLVLADDGIRERVETTAWDDVAAGIARGIRAGNPAPALIKAIGRCAELLNEHGVPANVTDELSNEPRFRDE